MSEKNKFPLLSENISIDLVNTEVVRWGQRYDLFKSNEDILDWIYVVNQHHSFLNEQLVLATKEHLSVVTPAILQLRKLLREEFEAIADEQQISSHFISFLENLIVKAPFTYKLIENKLIPFPLGKIEDVLLSLIAFDVLNLIEQNKITSLKRCSNPECVLLFIDVSGRRKWCSMKICGNRKKAEKFSKSKNQGKEAGTKVT